MLIFSRPYGTRYWWVKVNLLGGRLFGREEGRTRQDFQKVPEFAPVKPFFDTAPAPFLKG
jgi:hypothetical protein